MPPWMARLRSVAAAAFAVGLIAAGAVSGSADGLERVPPTPAVMQGVSAVTPAGGYLDGIACPSQSRCLAVGFSGPELSTLPLVEDWTGRSLNLAAGPVASDTELEGISCPSADSCIAVGAKGDAAKGEGRTFGASYNGRTWTVQSTPSPPTSTGDTLQSVDCPTPASCWAVGAVNGATPEVAVLVEHWNGGAWAVERAPAPGESRLYAVSCSSAVNCWAVGESHVAEPPYSPLAEHWNGKIWTTVAVPGSNGGLTAVTCVDAGGRWATGTTNGLDLVLHLVGGAWRRVSTAPTASRYGGIACPGVDECVAVGEGYLAGTHGEFAGGGAFWNGTAWTSLTDSKKANQATFSAVACPSPGECLAVGSNTEPGSANRVIAASLRPR